MKTTVSRLNITTKLALLLFLFIIIFYGTIALVFYHVQQMKTISQEIVTVDTKIINYSKELSRFLLDMDASAQKYSLLKTEGYLETYQSASKNFEQQFYQLSSLITKSGTTPQSFSIFKRQYEDFLQNQVLHGTSSPVLIDKETTQRWLNSLVDLHDSNRNAINESLVSIHDQAQDSIRNGLLGLSLSIIAAFLGVMFISKSIIIPLKQLTHALRDLSEGKDTPQIHVSSQDAFQDLAVAYNDMSSELREQENLRADFIAALSHEIRTPLTSIQESVSLIVEELMGPITNRQRELLKIAIEELKRLRELLNHLMHTSLLEIGSTPKTSQQIEPSQLISDCLTLLEPTARRKNIQLAVSSNDYSGLFSGCREEIQQILVNIIGNAIKFSPENSKISIHIRQQGEKLIIEIADQGPGIREDEKLLIFKKYYRSKSIRKHMNGVGLGLFISKRIVQHLGGSLTVENNNNKGCTFTVSLPGNSNK